MAQVLKCPQADGSVRFYTLPATSVQKAIRNLDGEISGVAFGVGKATTDLTDVWISVERRALKFNLASEKLILSRDDATERLLLTEDDDDDVNEIAVSPHHLAFACDSGIVGYIDLASKTRTLMKTSHEQIASHVSFIPNRPRELLSGGYDSCLLHHDFQLQTLLSKFDIAQSSSQPQEPSESISLAPPFIQSLAISPHGTVAAGTADGRLFVGTGGSKESNTGPRAKRRRKWEGLRASTSTVERVAEGPIVGMNWSEDDRLFMTTLGGSLNVFGESDGKMEKIGHGQTAECFKVNDLAVVQVGEDVFVVIAGLTRKATGIIEIWQCTKEDEIARA
ncbi:WD40 repeat-like protein [Sistotremastrum niveocremeum HHB9708]|uniref:WD40 repeat-like protein n=1 Tax=Sistotremastrum niveocremeum HHB9708 TaxID=1314777 RepID=A0A164S438_9AGAM|nr:WD40 repeat-like protein [Sistotremastrum niveocremeum HHB9708]